LWRPVPRVALLSTVVSEPTGEDENWFHNLPEPLRDLSEADEKIRTRQMAWARLEYIWLKYYRMGRFEEAIKHLRDIRTFIVRNLTGTQIPSRWPSHGTLSRWHYFHAHCLRATRKFIQAEQEFATAQAEAHLRLRDKQLQAITALNEHPSRIDAAARIAGEVRFSVICTSRILAALGRVALQQGQLRKAKQFLASAQTLIEGTGQEFMKLSVRCWHAIADRRLSDPRQTETGCLEALAQLKACSSDYATIRDVDANGQFICEVELARGYLDIALYARDADTTARRTHLDNARASLVSINTLLESNSKMSRPLSWNLRHWLLWTKYYLVFPDLSMARDAFRHIQQNNESGRNRSQRTDHNLFEGLLQLQEGNTDTAINVLNQVLATVTNDPVVESECHILLAECYIKSRLRRSAAQHHLDSWSVLSRSVDNAYLYCAEDRVTSEFQLWQRDFTIRFDEDNLNWDKWEHALRVWLLTAARARFDSEPTLEQLHKILGPSPSTLSRWPRSFVKNASAGST